MMKLSDYVVQYLTQEGVRDVFLVSGGGIMHLLDAVGRNSGVRYTCNYHEQASVVAAEAYARHTGQIGVALVTVGPGAANAVAGLPGAWVDSVPVLVLSGQVRQNLIADYTKLRQFGPQEANTLAMAQPVTKYAVRVTDPRRIRYELGAAFFYARSGRPGPVWIEIPLDVQSAEIDETRLEAFAPLETCLPPASHQIDSVIEALRQSRRPLVIAGNGVRAGGAEHLLHELLDRTRIPVALPFTAKDAIEEDYPRYMGIFGTAGQRRANFAVQNADCILVLAAGLNTQKVGFNSAGFAPKAKRIIVDIDPAQIHEQVLKPGIAVCADIAAFLEAFLERNDLELEPSPRWLEACALWKQRFPLITSDYFERADCVNSYLFMDRLSEMLSSNDTIVTGAGLDAVSCYQAFRVKRGQRVLISGWGSMGWDLPMAVGACIGSGRRKTICVTGDGSMQWNIQELLTIQRNQLPVKIFVFNNSGYASIRGTQTAFFEGRFVGADFPSGLANPDFEKLAAAYGLQYSRVFDDEHLRPVLATVLTHHSPAICEVHIHPEQAISPKATAFRRADGTFESRPLEDMAPFLSREELLENMSLFEDL